MGEPGVKKWRILIAVESLAHGGCERDATKIVLGLDRSRFEPHVAVFHDGGFRRQEVESAGVPILTVPVRSFVNSTVLHGARLLGDYIRQHQIQLVHAFDVPVDLFFAPVARINRVPVVITSQLSYRSLCSRPRQIALRVADRLSDRVVVNSRAVGQSLERQWGFPADRLFLSYNGVNPIEFHPGPGKRPAGFEDALVVGSVCVMRPEKRIDWVMQSFAEVSRLNPKLRLLLVGSGPEVVNLMALRDRLGLQEICHFEPGHPQVADWMRGMDIFINSSVSESFPNALLEAMACGCCVIGSNVGGIPELISQREDGLVFDSNRASDLTESLRVAATDAPLRQKMRQQASLTAHQRFSIQLALQRTEKLYQGLLEQKGIRPVENSA